MDDPRVVRPKTFGWVLGQLGAGERVVRVEVLVGGITAEVRQVVVAGPDGRERGLVLRSYVGVDGAERALEREAAALTLLSATDVVAPELCHPCDPARRAPSYLHDLDDR